MSSSLSLFGTNLNVAKFSNSLDESPYRTFDNFINSPFAKLKPTLKKDYHPGDDLLMWALDYDLHNYLPEDVLNITDRMSMQNGVEVRVPFLDNPLLDFRNRLSGNEIFGKGQKWILKDILKNHHLLKFANRKKEGFGLPISAWISDMNKKGLMESLNSSKSLIFNYIDYQLFHVILNEHLKGKADNGQIIWSVFVLSSWLRNEFE